MKTTCAPTDRSTPSTPSTCPGRPTTYNPRAAQILLTLIREAGLSDSAAAAKAAISTSSLSRWKREYPDFALALLQAREEFREFHLQVIFEAAKTRGGWRASAWILQHVFPGDYSPRAAEREKFQRLAEQEAERQGTAQTKDAELIIPATLSPSRSQSADPSRRSSSAAHMPSFEADPSRRSISAAHTPSLEADPSRRSSSSAQADTSIEPGLLDEILSGNTGENSQKPRPAVMCDRIIPSLIGAVTPPLVR